VSGTGAEWRLVIRRAYGIPDLIGDEVALERVRELVHQQAFEGKQLGPMRQVGGRPEEMVRHALDAVLIGAEKGELDRYLVGSPSKTPEELAEDFAIQNDPNWGPGNREIVRDVFLPILETLRTFVEGYPWTSTPTPSSPSRGNAGG